MKERKSVFFPCNFCFVLHPSCVHSPGDCGQCGGVRLLILGDMLGQPTMCFIGSKPKLHHSAVEFRFNGASLYDQGVSTPSYDHVGPDNNK